MMNYHLGRLPDPEQPETGEAGQDGNDTGLETGLQIRQNDSPSAEDLRRRAMEQAALWHEFFPDEPPAAGHKVLPS